MRPVLVPDSFPELPITKVPGGIVTILGISWALRLAVINKDRIASLLCKLFMMMPLLIEFPGVHEVLPDAVKTSGN